MATTQPPATGDGGPFEPAGVVWSPVSRRLSTVRRVVTCGPLALVALGLVVVGLALGWSWLSLSALVPVLLAVWVWWLVGRQVGAWGYAERDDDLLIRHGVLLRSIVVVPYGRMQYVDVQAGPVDRVFGIARVQLHTASAATDAWIPGLPSAEAARLRDRLASLGQARLAGL